jgi:hypothetical protein
MVVWTRSAHPFASASNSFSTSHPRLSSPGSNPIKRLAETFLAWILPLASHYEGELWFVKGDDEKDWGVDYFHYDLVKSLICSLFKEWFQGDKEEYLDKVERGTECVFVWCADIIECFMREEG